MMDAQQTTMAAAHAVIRARVLDRVGDYHGAPGSLEERLDVASDDIRNALVPVQTIAALLQGEGDAESRSWCAAKLREEVRRIVEILDGLGR